MKIFMPIVIGKPPPARFGFSIAHQNSDEWRKQSLATFNPEIWKNWLWNFLYDASYLPNVYAMRPSALNAAAMQEAKTDPLRTWELGNEPENSTSAIAPVVAAAFVQKWLQAVGDNFCAPSIILTPAGYTWLEAYLDAGAPVGKFWSAHIYWRKDSDEWRGTWLDWCEWLDKRRILRPTLITETSGPGGCNQIALMNGIRELLRTDPLLNAALWYSDRDWHGIWHYSDLVDSAGICTPLGEHYRQLART